MSIWVQDVSPEALQRQSDDCMVDHLGIRFTEIGPDYISATMPVDQRTHQPFGLLHGGASVSLAETLGSVGANLCVDPSRCHCVGQEINANHVLAVRNGLVTGTARPVHIGRRSQVWEIRIVDGRDRLCCISRITMAVVEHKPPHPTGQIAR